MISITYLMAYEGGDIVPGDDMGGAGYRWLALDDLASGQATVGIPRERWLLRRAIEMSRLWAREEVELQSPIVFGE